MNAPYCANSGIGVYRITSSHWGSRLLAGFHVFMCLCTRIQSVLVLSGCLYSPARYFYVPTACWSDSSKIGGKTTGLRRPSNTLDIRRFTELTEIQRIFDQHIEKVIDSTDSSTITSASRSVVYLQHSGASSAKDVALKVKVRNWAKTHPLVNKAYAADISDGGDNLTVVELALDEWR